MPVETKGVCAPKGFMASGIHCGLSKNPNRKELSLLYSMEPCVAAGVTTTNVVCAAPVQVTRQHLLSGSAQAIICNSMNANACTANGMSVAKQTCEAAAEALCIKPEDVLVASTGVIGQELDLKPIQNGIPLLIDGLADKGCKNFAEGILTTDTSTKEAMATFFIGDKEVTIGAAAKGSGMIHPNMATMLGFIATDVAIAVPLLQKALKSIVNDTFNMISVDGDTSTNDMVLILANGCSQCEKITQEDENYQLFYNALLEVCKKLAIAIAKDGEGATRLLTCHVTGGQNEIDCKKLAKSIISSSLLKAAMFGKDANWGRVLCAAGYSGAKFNPDDVDINFISEYGKVLVCKSGQGVLFDEDLAAKVLNANEISIELSIGTSTHEATAWGCDLTYDYVKINGAYRT